MSQFTKKNLNLWSRILSATNPKLEKDRWNVEDAAWVRERHTFRGQHYAYFVEVHNLSLVPKRGRPWVLMVVTENWWDRGKSIRSSQWGTMRDGSKHDALAWLRRQGENLKLSGL